ncbi:MAG: hypothetical protein AAGA53_02250 [Pseudomonadota bacterium]
MDTETYTDEILTAYLDHELDLKLSEQIKHAAATDAILAQRIARLNISSDEIGLAMEPLLDLAPSVPELPVDIRAETESLSKSWAQTLKTAAASLIILAVGGVFGFALNEQPEDGWQDYVAAYHLLYVSSTLSNIETDAAVQANELTRVGDALAKPLTLDTLTRFGGLDYKRAQILGYEGKPIAQMTFLSKMGVPIALCIIRSGPGEKEGLLRHMEMEGMASTTWAKDGYEYLLIGGKDRNLIEDAAAAFSRIL